ncbi:protein of unknown function [Bradyrhizobium vignae]|uniref:Uncharacterized protein n=1 Tax=Bradyrhizobium vignae TaxID=1549949 RepID=A0A2U3PZH0_9BRAD|nr:protein of unknown function [Bradyrhizobium vignae]
MRLASLRKVRANSPRLCEFPKLCSGVRSLGQFRPPVGWPPPAQSSAHKTGEDCIKFRL